MITDPFRFSPGSAERGRSAVEHHPARAPVVRAVRSIVVFAKERLDESYAGDESADFFQRAADPAGIAGELHGRGVGEEFALPRDRGLDQPAEEHADVPHDEQRESEH